jgi:hypothetical protein
MLACAFLSKPNHEFIRHSAELHPCFPRSYGRSRKKRTGELFRDRVTVSCVPILGEEEIPTIFRKILAAGKHAS